MNDADRERAIQLLEYYGEKLGCNAEFDLAIKALEVVEKIKKAYSNCYKSYLNNLENGFSEETASFAFFQDVAFNINNILCEAYGSDIDCESWVKEKSNDA